MSLRWNLQQSVTIQMKATVQCWVLFVIISVYKVVLPSLSVDEILKCADKANESYWAVFYCGSVCYAVQDNSNFRESVDE